MARYETRSGARTRRPVMSEIRPAVRPAPWKAKGWRDALGALPHKDLDPAALAAVLAVCRKENRCPQCGTVAPCLAVHLGGRRHRHTACSIACARLREAAKNQAVDRDEQDRLQALAPLAAYGARAYTEREDGPR